IFDPGKHGAFLLDAPPSPWIDLGEIEKFQRTSGTEVQAMIAGTTGTPARQFRRALDAKVEFEFREWGKLQMALAGGSEHMNVLALDPNAPAQPSGGTPLAAIAVLPSSTAFEIFFGAAAVSSFSVGDIVVVDAHYQ